MAHTSRLLSPIVFCLPLALLVGCGDGDTPAQPPLEAGTDGSTVALGDLGVESGKQVDAPTGSVDATDSALDTAPRLDVIATALDVGAMDSAPSITFAVERGVSFTPGFTPGNAIAYPLTSDEEGNVFLSGNTSEEGKLGLADSDAGNLANDSGPIGTPFAAKIAPTGQLLWKAALPYHGVPAGITRDGAEVVVVSTKLEARYQEPFSYSSSCVLSRFDANGRLVASAVLDFGADTIIPFGLVVDNSRHIHVYANLQAQDGTTTLLVTELGVDLSSTRSTKFTRTGGHMAVASAISRAANGDLLLTGYFDGELEVAGKKLVAEGTATDGFVVRLTPAHTLVFASRFGGTDFDNGQDIVEKDGSIYLGGSLTGAATVGTKAVAADRSGSAFVAKLDELGVASWVEVFPAGTSLMALATGKSRVFAMTKRPGSIMTLDDVATQPAVTFSSLGSPMLNPGSLAAGGASLWVSVGYDGPLSITPPGTQLPTSTSALLLALPQ